MKGVVFLGNRRAEVKEFPIPEPSEDEVLVRVMATGICGSDLSVYRISEGYPDQIRGHEPSGVIEAVGSRVTHRKPGERVSVHHHQGCGVCPQCARGETVACPEDQCIGVSVPGSFAEYLCVKERNCVVLPESVSFIDGAFMACVGGTAYGAYTRLNAKAHESVAVFGLGPVGLSCVLVGKAMGLRVVGVDLAEERLALATRCGADAVVNSSEGNVPARIHQAVGAQTWRDGVDYVIETSGSTGARECIIPSLRREGKAAIVGVGSTERVINPSDIHGRAVTILGSVVFPLGWMWDLARFCAISGLSFEPAVTHRLPIEEAVEGLRLADEAKDCGKVVFLPND
ncbi:MAG: zinc-binding dehydrogenase [Armatimonadetes bacterium]|nr:zinc-binding dehydrogenase [Armatimonadota bacterium]MBM4036649.1 zinc-binding dehydrogenase [Planctomycetota bacterium]